MSNECCFNKGLLLSSGSFVTQWQLTETVYYSITQTARPEEQQAHSPLLTHPFPDAGCMLHVPPYLQPPGEMAHWVLSQVKGGVGPLRAEGERQPRGTAMCTWVCQGTCRSTLSQEHIHGRVRRPGLTKEGLPSAVSGFARKGARRRSHETSYVTMLWMVPVRM